MYRNIMVRRALPQSDGISLPSVDPKYQVARGAGSTTAQVVRQMEQGALWESKKALKSGTKGKSDGIAQYLSPRQD